MSNTEKKLKPLKNVKALKQQKEIDEQLLKPAVRIQKLKNRLAGSRRCILLCWRRRSWTRFKLTRQRAGPNQRRRRAKSRRDPLNLDPRRP